MLPARPDKVRIPLEISVIIALLTRHLRIDVNRFVNKPIRARAARGTDVNCNRACRSGIRSGYVLLCRNGIGPFRTRRVALAHPAKPEGC